MRGLLGIALALAGIGFLALGAAWRLTTPERLPETERAVAENWAPDAEAEARGARLFALGACASCHAAPGAKDEARLALSGGRRFETAFGVFVAPNISPDPEAGIGGWSAADFADALLRGVSPKGEHYYPAFPYASYARMEVTEALDLLAYLRTLPADATPSGAHELGFPWNQRRGLGLWKRLHLSDAPVVAGLDGAAERGRRIVEGVGHCGECHTPRDGTGGLKLDRWLGGGPNPDGKGDIPNLTPSEKGLGGWSEADVAYYLESGFTPDYDSVGGSMVVVVEELAKVPPEDRADVAAYLKAIPALD